MAFTIRDIAARLGAASAGDTGLTVSGAAEPATAGPDQLAVALSPGYASGLAQGQARTALLWPDADWQTLGLQAAIFAPRGRLALARLTQMLDPGQGRPGGRHASAIVDPSAILGPGVGIGPFATIGAAARIGAGSHIGAHASIAPGAVIGPGSLIGEGVRIGARVHIGARAILHPNVVIGADGFSFVTAQAAHAEVARATLGQGVTPPSADPTWHRIHSLGGVSIGDDVEIGANSTVDAGTIRATRIGDGTKIDNLVQVGHNVIIGRYCLLCAQSGVAGSAQVGDRTVIGGQAGVADNIAIGHDVVLSGGTIALSNVPAGRVMMGYPAVQMTSHIESYKALRRLPRILRDLAARQKPVSKPGQSD